MVGKFFQQIRIFPSSCNINCRKYLSQELHDVVIYKIYKEIQQKKYSPLKCMHHSHPLHIVWLRDIPGVK